MKVLKFGGSSVAKPERIRMILDILKDYYTQGEKFAVVFSAFGGVTDSLIEMSRLASKGDERYLELFEAFSKRHLDTIDDLLNEENAKLSRPKLEKNHEVLKNLLHGVFLVREASARTMDYVLSFGERNSCFIIQAALQQSGIPSSFLDARKIIKTDKHFGAANVDMEHSFKNIKEYFNSHPEVQVVTGFIASSKGNLTTTLGRGGSDYTASLLAAGLNAALLEIWTDVNGVLTADPRKVKRAFTIPSMTYAEAMEMSHFGAKVIYPPTLQPALNKNIPLQIKNTFEPDNPGTLITDKGDKTDLPVKGISSITDLALLTLQGSGLFGVPGIAGRLFGSLAMADINIILITQGSSEHSISFAIQPSLARKAKRQIEKTFEYEMKAGMIDPVKVEDNLSVIAIIGENMRYSPGIAGRLFQALGKNGINITAIAQGSSELNISVVIDRPDEAKALNSLHEAFFLSDTKELHLYLIGVGLIGSTLLKQIKAHADHLKSQQSIEIKVVGLSNSKKMIFDENGINLNTWQEDLQNAPQHSNIPAFIQQMKDNNLSNTIFVDNTANEMIAGHYESILDSSISISTPNKIATSSSYLQYRRLKNIATKRGVQFMYETNVGAGLPIISTLNDLMISGDSILKIEGVLSGSLSFIFNNFKAGTKFSELVSLAREKGFTEPDPRIDINGIDVRRKLIILARETGLNIEAEDVVIKNILPEACSKAKSVDDFFTELKKADDYFDQMLKKASAKNCVLRMVAKLQNDKATIGLEEVDPTHPFYTLDGSDNMIVFTTERYKERPLVVRGPGAGAEVTAAGVFAEVIKIGNFIT